jgi:hypothetical protein
MFCAPWLVFCGAECVGSRFHVLRARTNFRLYRGRRVSFSGFARSNSFSAVPRATRPVFMFRARTLFRRYRGRQVPFSCFALPDSFSCFVLIGYISTHNLMQINIITSNYAYYKIVQLTLRYEYPTTLIFHKT